MAVLKCKMCGGDLHPGEGVSTAECEYCGSVQTVPRADDEKKMALFGRANRLRIACDFDKAAGIYEAILTDFPEEAEAYWGLVLCKYGIEYVESPSDGRRVPTCHRSSYDNVLEDDNFDQAMENADVIAQRLYREEAQELERLRKGILEVSSKEDPYDIFICYKETDPVTGDRTLDSVLAQDLYSALTDKGYRVFFSRITLRDKLGVDYEPYIFSALNSAKVMLAVGTRYEYYNAVWVKNEWSRYLKICEEDKEKHLIPCYRDIKTADMPKEFNHLQGADLGKMGAIQDILFNMEKYISLKKETPAASTASPVGGNQLLKRGQMALEDRAWSDADKYFEEALNQNAECAEAYLGKALAQARCGNLKEMAVAEANRAANQTAKTRIASSPNEARIQAAVNAYAVPGYLEAAEIRKRYSFDLHYESAVSGWESRRASALTAWDENRYLNRAARFAVGDTARELVAARNLLNDELNEKSTQIREAENRARAELEQRYAAFLNQVDGIMAQKSAEAKAAREQFQRNCENRLQDFRGLLPVKEAELAELRKDLKKINGYNKKLWTAVLMIIFPYTAIIGIVMLIVNKTSILNKLQKKYKVTAYSGNDLVNKLKNHLARAVADSESEVQNLRTQINTLERGGTVQTGGFDASMFQDFFGGGTQVGGFGKR